MILKTAANYNDEGGYIEAWKNSDGTTEVKLIPKSGGDEDKNGIKSITITPAIETTPALDSVFPIYYEDLTEEEKEEKEKVVFLETESAFSDGEEITATATATADWFVSDGDEWSAKGGTISITGEFVESGSAVGAILTFAMSGTADFDSDDYFEVKIMISGQKK